MRSGIVRRAVAGVTVTREIEYVLRRLGRVKSGRTASTAQFVHGKGGETEADGG